MLHFASVELRLYTLSLHLSPNAFSNNQYLTRSKVSLNCQKLYSIYLLWSDTDASSKIIIKMIPDFPHCIRILLVIAALFITTFFYWCFCLFNNYYKFLFRLATAFLTEDTLDIPPSLNDSIIVVWLILIDTLGPL